MVGEAVQQRAGEAPRSEDPGPLVEREVGGHQDGAPLVALVEDLEEQFRPGGGQGDEAQRIDDQQAGAGPGDSPFTIDLDSTICETYGLDKEGARHHGYTGARGYHPLLAAGTGDVLLARLREGRANTARGGSHFLRETVGRVRYGGARGQLKVRADSGFYTHSVVAVCRKLDVRFSITIRQHKSLHNLIEAIAEDAWTPIPYWMDGAADVAETTYTLFRSEPDAAPVRLIVRRVKPNLAYTKMSIAGAPNNQMQLARASATFQSLSLKIRNVIREEHPCPNTPKTNG